jgi:hypothetical protein
MQTANASTSDARYFAVSSGLCVEKETVNTDFKDELYEKKNFYSQKFGLYHIDIDGRSL